MKAFKRIFALVISLAIITSCAFSSVVFAADGMTDVAEDHIYYKAIYDLVGKGIITGYTDGTFKPEGNITRAEFCAIIARADAPNGHVFTSTKSSFSDVASQAEWAIGYIEYAASRNIVNGFEDGTFRPNENVTYAQAVKMIVCALNYGAVAEKTEVWYQGYLNLAMQLNLTKNAVGAPDAPAVRGLVAQLTYNMNNTPSAVQTGVDNEGNPIFSVGNSSYENEVNGTETIEGQVIAVSDEALERGDTDLNRYQAEIKHGSKTTIFTVSGSSYSIDDIKEYLGYYVQISYSENNSGEYVIERIKKDSSNHEYTINDNEIVSVSSSSIEYYDDDAKNGTSEYKFDDIKVLRNGGTIDPDAIEEELSITNGNIVFLDYDDDGDMDVAFVNSYTTMWVGKNQPNTKKTEYTITDKLTETSKTFKYNVAVKNASNNSFTEGDIANITKDSVISIAVAADDEDDIEIIVSKNTVSSVEVKGVDETYNEIKLGEKVYTASGYYFDNIDNTKYPQSLKYGDKCTAYLDFMGKIVAVNKAQSTNQYGYVIEVGTTGGMKGTCVVTLYNGSSIVNYDIVEKGFKINGKSANPEDLIDEIEAAAERANANKSGHTNNERAALVKYELNNGMIKAIYLDDGTNDIDTVKLSVAYDGTNSFKYSSNKFTAQNKDEFRVSSNTKVFFVPENRADDNKYTRASFVANDLYIIDAYDVEDGVAKAVVVYGKEAKIAARTSKTVLVKAIENVIEDGKTVEQLVYEDFTTVSSDQEKTINTKEEDTLSSVGVGKGDVIKILENDGVIEKAMIIFDASELDLNKDNDVLDPNGAKYDEDKGWIKHVTGTQYYYATYGEVVFKPDLDNGVNNIEIVCGDSEEIHNFTVSDKIVVAKYNKKASDNEFFEIAYFDSLVAKKDAEGDNPAVEGNKILIISHEINSVIQGIIIYE